MPKVVSALSRESSIRRTAKHVLIGGLAILTIKFGIFALTNSTAVLADAMESIVNLVAAIIMLYGVWMMQRPGDDNKPTGHSKSQYMMIGFEGWLILIIGAVVGYISVDRLFQAMDADDRLALKNLQIGIWCSGGVALLTTVLAVYVLNAGKKSDSQVLIADGKHLLADVASTLGVIVGLSIVHSYYPDDPSKVWIDPVVAIVITGIVLYTSWRLMWKSVTGLTDTYEQEMDPTIELALDDLLAQKKIAGYDDVRYRFNGPHRWVELTVFVDPDMTIRSGQDVAKATEKRLNTEFEDAKIQVNVEPFKGKWPPKIWAEIDERIEAEKVQSETDATDSKASADATINEGDPIADQADGQAEKNVEDGDAGLTSGSDATEDDETSTASAEDVVEPRSDSDAASSPKPDLGSDAASDVGTEDNATKPYELDDVSEPFEQDNDEGPEPRFGDDVFGKQP